MKAQVNIISVVLLTGIVIALVGAAYLWGVPLIEKRSAITKLETAKTFMNKVNSGIITLANTGAGTETFDIPFGMLNVIPYDSIHPDNNSIVMEFVVSQPLLLSNRTVYLDATSFEEAVREIGIYGVARPNILTLNTEREAGGWKIKFKLHFRELDTVTSPLRGFKIALMNEAIGTQRITADFSETLSSGRANNGGDLMVTFIDASVV